ncbi:Protein of unknown function [Gryllus bimaculatus]|nr:Protein of unknown function [Gryllus bimaculatus]
MIQTYLATFEANFKKEGQIYLTSAVIEAMGCEYLAEESKLLIVSSKRSLKPMGRDMKAFNALLTIRQLQHYPEKHVSRENLDMVHLRINIFTVLVMIGFSIYPVSVPGTSSKSVKGRFWLLPISSEKRYENSGTKQNVSNFLEETVRFAFTANIDSTCDTKGIYLFVDELIMQIVASRFKKRVCLKMRPHEHVPSLLNGSADVSIYAEWQMLPPPKPVDYLYPHARDDMCLMVKRRRREQQSILQAFSAATWSATGATLAAFARERERGERGKGERKRGRENVTSLLSIQDDLSRLQRRMLR